MYLINKIHENYEGVWSNTIVYEIDLNTAIELANDFHQSFLSLKQKYLKIKEGVNSIMRKQYPHYQSTDPNISFDEQIKSIDKNNNEDYFEKEERLIKEAIEKELSFKEKFLHNYIFVDFEYNQIYFEVKKIYSAEEILKISMDKNEFWSVQYSTKPALKK